MVTSNNKKKKKEISFNNYISNKYMAYRNKYQYHHL